jgi:hypothetical protein
MPIRPMIRFTGLALPLSMEKRAAANRTAPRTPTAP